MHFGLVDFAQVFTNITNNSTTTSTTKPTSTPAAPPWMAPSKWCALVCAGLTHISDVPLPESHYKTISVACLHDITANIQQQQQKHHDKKDYANGPSGAPFQITDNAPSSPLSLYCFPVFITCNGKLLCFTLHASVSSHSLSTTIRSPILLHKSFRRISLPPTISPSRVPAILLRPLALYDTSLPTLHTSIAACWSCTADNLAVLFLSDSTSLFVPGICQHSCLFTLYHSP